MFPKQINASEVKALVESGKKLEDICNHFKDDKGNPMNKSEAKRILKVLDLTIKKTRTPRFVLNNDLNTTNIPVVTETVVEA